MAWTDGATSGQGSTRAWRKIRRDVLDRDGYQCQLGYPDCTGYADEVDHIDDVASSGHPRFAIPPAHRLRAVCRHCHGRRTQAQARAGRSRWKRQPELHPGIIR